MSKRNLRIFAPIAIMLVAGIVFAAVAAGNSGNAK
jgi:hypothetical protein